MNTILRNRLANMAFNEQLRFLRKRNRNTQQIVGDLVGLSGRTIRAFETAERLPDIATVSLLIEVLCLDKFEATTVFNTWEAEQNQMHMHIQKNHKQIAMRC